MNLTLYTRHALTVLAHLARVSEPLPSTGQIARTCGISHNHLMKIVHALQKAGFVETVRGRRGGIRLARPAREVTLGEIVRHTESGPGPGETGLGPRSGPNPLPRCSRRPLGLS